MLELFTKNKGLGILIIGAASQLAGIIFYVQTTIVKIDHTAEQVKELVTDVQALQGKVQNQSFTIDRLSYQNTFQNEALEEEIERLEDDLATIESQIMSR